MISGSSVENIRVDAGNNTIQGNFIGTSAAGTASLGTGLGPNASGIFINGQSGITIGGTNPGEGNLISGNPGYGLVTNGVHGVIQGNLIGTDVTGQAAVCNGVAGIALGYNVYDNLIGGSTTASRNVISGNCGPGIRLMGSGSGLPSNKIEGNYIGVDATGVNALPNAGAGVQAEAVGSETSIYSVIGGDSSGEGNVIAYNAGPGVVVLAAGSIGNRVTGNSIFDNGGLRIDIDNDEPTTNDANDVDGRPSRREHARAVISDHGHSHDDYQRYARRSACGSLGSVRLLRQRCCDPSGIW